jgi:AcrR family transcriptional regulator
MKRANAMQRPAPRHSAISADAVAADQRRRILDALPDAVAENGIEATTVEHVVKLAGVRRNSFYEQFSDKRDCFAAAHEIAQERLLGVLTFQCYTHACLPDRLGTALAAGLTLLGGHPSLARLIVVEAPAAGGEITVRHQEWLDRYCRLLQLAAVASPDISPPKPALEPAIVGSVVSRVKQLVLAGQAGDLPRLCPELVQLTLSYYSSPALPRTPSAGAPAESSQPQSPERRAVPEPA